MGQQERRLGPVIPPPTRRSPTDATATNRTKKDPDVGTNAVARASHEGNLTSFDRLFFENEKRRWRRRMTFALSQNECVGLKTANLKEQSSSNDVQCARDAIFCAFGLRFTAVRKILRHVSGSFYYLASDSEEKANIDTIDANCGWTERSTRMSTLDGSFNDVS